jgi:ethanolamine utilization protein EutQ (cupin superfamily)
MECKVDFEALPWESPLEGMRHKLVRHGGRQLRLVEYSEAMEPHWCERGHIGCVLEGRFEITVGDEVLIFGPGDGVFLPAGPAHRHMGRVLGGPVRALFVEDA